MIERRTLLEAEGITVSDVACRHHGGRGDTVESSRGHMLIFVRRGCFVRSADGVESLLDPSVAYCINPGEEQRYDHPHVGGDDCTALALSAEMLAGLWGGDQFMPVGAFPTSSLVDLGHRTLLAAARRSRDPHALHERAIAVVADALEQRDPRRVASGKPATDTARRKIVDASREALAADRDLSLPELARCLGVSPHHLSRIFRVHTGHTIARHRMLLRARHALELIADGEGNLARLAADLGFADQGHLCRVVKTLTGETPAILRNALASN